MAWMWEEAAQECQQQGAIGDKMAVLPGALKEEEAIKEKDKLLREAQAEVAQEHQLQSIELKVRDLLKTEVALLRSTVEKVKVIAEEALWGGERKLLSVPEMEELEQDEGVVPEALAPRVLKAHPVVVKKIKSQELKVPQGEEQPPPQVVEHSMVHPCTQAELMDLGSRFKQKPSESISAWLLRLWDLGVDGIVLSGSEMGKLSSLTVQPALRQRLQNAHQTPGSHSLLYWLRLHFVLCGPIRVIYHPLLLDGRHILSSNRCYES
ncbi:uncharacterized protein LOC130682934 [Manis pentadactyla]|uniref:uncharacterized protein LOC130682934 n=1 Tax=Manis pentadactyla TaxID=143292 RepID=UPI00255C73F8|nr:uncharacterized protein LOC130682934 [Manis pentadactyla]